VLDSIRVGRSTTGTRIGTAVLMLASAGFALVPFVAPAGEVSQLVNLFVYLVLAVMWNLLAGFGGMISIGQQAYLGLGAYGLVLLADHAGVDPFLAVPLAALAAGALAVPISFLAFRLVGAYFAIGTWVIAEVVRLLTVQSSTLGGGSGVTLHALADLDRVLRIAYTYWFALATAVLAVLAGYLLNRSKFGLGLTAVRDDATAAASNGVPVRAARRLVFVVAAAGCGAAGGVVALSSLQVQPDSVYGVQWSAFMIFMVVVGGVGTMEGPILGAVLFYALQRWLAVYNTVYLMVLGAVAIAIVLFAPRGLWGLLGGGRWRAFPLGYRVQLPRKTAPPTTEPTR